MNPNRFCLPRMLVSTPLTIARSGRRVNRIAALAAAIVVAMAAPAAAAELSVAAASDTRLALDELAVAFEKATGNHVTVTYGSSGKLYAQIVAGAPFDVYFSADATYPAKLEGEGLTLPDTRFAYGEGRLALWTNTPGVDVSKGLAGLPKQPVKHLAIAQPLHAPYGRAAVEALRYAKVYDTLADRLVMGENIAQAAHFAVSGAAEAAIVARSLLGTPELAKGRHWPIPTNWHAPMVQEAAIVRKSAVPKIAKAFCALVQGPKGRAVLQRVGLGRIGKD